jgi:hypothetical protein
MAFSEPFKIRSLLIIIRYIVSCTRPDLKMALTYIQVVGGLIFDYKSKVIVCPKTFCLKKLVRTLLSSKTFLSEFYLSEIEIAEIDTRWNDSTRSRFFGSTVNTLNVGDLGTIL